MGQYLIHMSIFQILTRHICMQLSYMKMIKSREQCRRFCLLYSSRTDSYTVASLNQNMKRIFNGTLIRLVSSSVTLFGLIFTMCCLNVPQENFLQTCPNIRSILLFIISLYLTWSTQCVVNARSSNFQSTICSILLFKISFLLATCLWMSIAQKPHQLLILQYFPYIYSFSLFLTKFAWNRAKEWFPS